MVPIDRDIINMRIEHIRENLRYLKEYAKKKKKEFMKDFKDGAAVERMLQTSIEAMTDIGNHIIAVNGFEAPLEYKDVFLILNKNGVIPDGFVDKLVEMVKFRNLIVHGYLGVEKGKIYDIIKNDLGDFERFIRLILKHIGK